jgi:hypothetical protein
MTTTDWVGWAICSMAASGSRRPVGAFGLAMMMPPFGRPQ